MVREDGSCTTRLHAPYAHVPPGGSTLEQIRPLRTCAARRLPELLEGEAGHTADRTDRRRSRATPPRLALLLCCSLGLVLRGAGATPTVKGVARVAAFSDGPGRRLTPPPCRRNMSMFLPPATASLRDEHRGVQGIAGPGALAAGATQAPRRELHRYPAESSAPVRGVPKRRDRAGAARGGASANVKDKNGKTPGTPPVTLAQLGPHTV